MFHSLSLMEEVQNDLVFLRVVIIVKVATYFIVTKVVSLTVNPGVQRVLL